MHVSGGHGEVLFAPFLPATRILLIFHKMTVQASAVLASGDFLILESVLGW